MFTEEPSYDVLKTENAFLRARVQELERALEACVPRESAEEQHHVPYRKIFDALPVSLGVYRRDGLSVAMNTTSLELIGGIGDEIIGKFNILEDPSSISAGFVENFQRAAALGKNVTMPPCAYETAGSTLATIDERTVWTETTYVPIKGDAGIEFLVECNIDVTERQKTQKALEEKHALLQALIDNAPMSIFANNLEDRTILVNQRCADAMRLPPEAILGKTPRDLLPEDRAEEYLREDRQVLEKGSGIEWESERVRDGKPYHILMTKFPLRETNGKVYGVCGISMDITQRRRAEADNRRLQEEIIRMQEESLRALSTPLIPIAEGVVVMPLIGSVNGTRAQQVMEALLEGVSRHRASIAILDVTGVTFVDRQVADALIRAAQAVSLLGSNVVLTGVRPEMARTLVEIGADLHGIVVHSTLQSAIQYALMY
ncbi:PAS domain-containing protein [Chondromyces apiculatus]|uniref:RsbR, positive regulator of sigma-B n=1 Tax=Chondromyces apiculatus DSM 436 TaxID=1192034 RepID=A0A017SV10_9BACT|nr:PAS domain-containing protein [Chondromyces apiculatus]EYF00819.1 RsbR, positive regulator of sigma-B [Chondromyces apiculatus DSM 436]